MWQCKRSLVRWKVGGAEKSSSRTVDQVTTCSATRLSRVQARVVSAASHIRFLEWVGIQSARFVAEKSVSIQWNEYVDVVSA